MSTINDAVTVYKLIDNNGQYDTSLYSVHAYVNAWGGIAYGLAYNERDHEGYSTETNYVKVPVLLWSRADGVTEDGVVWCAIHKSDPTFFNRGGV